MPLLYHARLTTLRNGNTSRVWCYFRCNHSASCSTYIYRFDSHCLMLGTKVEVQNFRKFFTFVLLATNVVFVPIVSCTLTLRFTTLNFCDILIDRISYQYIVLLAKKIALFTKTFYFYPSQLDYYKNIRPFTLESSWLSNAATCNTAAPSRKQSGISLRN